MSLQTHQPKTNGATLATAEVAKRERPQVHHGVPVLELRVGDPIPMPRAPVRYAVRVTPDLARHLLTLNVDNNRKRRERAVRRYARLMTESLWRFTPESLMFSVSGRLHNGQNRLMAVTEAGIPVWMVLDFGWPDDIISAVDQGERRSNADALAISGVVNSRRVASVVALWHGYVGVRAGDATRAFSSGVPLGAPEVDAIVGEDPDGWHDAASWGDRVYDALDKGLSATIWGAAYRIIADAATPLDAESYFAAVIDGTGEPRSATRVIHDWALRRRAKDTRTGDVREPLENVIRGFNAWRAGKTVSLVSRPGFPLSAVR